ncbi:MAG: type II toxin-antitoxin system RelE/ParE family toxin [Mariprofundaceae bacterium]|nr:type II toxin-antitoxin system RelE/ParE family toxin [Mariprofundaceae bacterium]
MAQIIWSSPALSDLEEIAEYIALDKVSAAQKLVKTIFSTVERLAEFPESGKFPSEIKSRKHREIIVGPCRIFYRYESEIVYIVYVMRSEREFRKYILNEREG